MKSLLSAFIEILDSKAYWRTNEIKTALLNLIGSTEQPSIDLVSARVPSREVSFSRERIEALLEAARNPRMNLQVEDYLNQIFLKH